VVNSSPIICAVSVIFTKLPKVNSRPTGENSPNLVTLVATYHDGADDENKSSQGREKTRGISN
jgi:hypothetical protein